MIGRTQWLVAILLVVSAAPAARADWFQELNRNLGLWWSDGYHSHGDCPPGHQRDWYATPRRNWQPSPGSAIEYLPTPAPLPEEGKSSRRPGMSAPARPVSVRTSR